MTLPCDQAQHHPSSPCWALPGARGRGLAVARQLRPSGGPPALQSAKTRPASCAGAPWDWTGECPTKLRREGPAAGYELLVAHDLKQHAAPAAGRRSGPNMAAARMGTAGMVGMRHQAALRLHPEAPSSLLGHQQRPSTAGWRPVRPRPGRPDPFRAVAARRSRAPLGGIVLWRGGRIAPCTGTWRQLGPPRSLRGPLTR